MEEHELVEGLRNRKDDAVEAFLDRYRALFYHCIGHFETDHAAREDLFQELVLYTLERLDRDRFDSNKGSFGTWLYRVAWCRCVDLKRKKSAQRNPNLSPVGDHLPDQPDPQPGPGELAGESEIGVLVQQGLESLGTEERALLALRYIDDRTLAEISERLSISLEQTKYRLKRASTQLRRVLLNQFALEEAAD